MTVPEDDFDCEAYGPAPEMGVAALCFFANPGSRVCAGPSVCHTRMTAERQRVFARIQEMAAAGDPDGAYLAGEFTSPDQLLGGGAGDPGE